MISCKALSSSFTWYWMLCLAKRFHQWGNLVEVVPGHDGEEVVLHLEVEVPAEPVIEGLLHIICGCHLVAKPVLVGLLVILYEDVIHLLDPHKPVVLQEPDEVEEKKMDTRTP